MLEQQNKQVDKTKQFYPYLSLHIEINYGSYTK